MFMSLERYERLCEIPDRLQKFAEDLEDRVLRRMLRGGLRTFAENMKNSNPLIVGELEKARAIQAIIHFTESGELARGTPYRDRLPAIDFNVLRRLTTLLPGPRPTNTDDILNAIAGLEGVEREVFLDTARAFLEMNIKMLETLEELLLEHRLAVEEVLGQLSTDDYSEKLDTVFNLDEVDDTTNTPSGPLKLV